MSDFEANLVATGDVMNAYQRLVDRGLAVEDPSTRGLNDDGMQALTDLLDVLTFQTRRRRLGGGAGVLSHVPGDAVGSGRPVRRDLRSAELTAGTATNDGVDMLQLLTAAVREARG